MLDMAGMKIGFHFSDNFRCSYLAYIEDGKVKYEDSGAALLLFKDVFEDADGEHRVEIRSEGMNQGNTCHILIDGSVYSIGQKGFNIVVYDKNERMVTDSVAIDTYPPVFFFEENNDDYQGGISR